MLLGFAAGGLIGLGSMLVVQAPLGGVTDVPDSIDRFSRGGGSAPELQPLPLPQSVGGDSARLRVDPSQTTDPSYPSAETGGGALAPLRLTWSPLERYQQLCADPSPNAWPWIEVARGLAEIGAHGESLDSWWQAYRRGTELPEPRAFFAQHQESWTALVLGELRRFDCGFDERSGMERDLVALLGPTGRLGEACEALRVPEFVDKLRRRETLEWYDLRDGARWRVLASCDPLEWESLLTRAVASTDFNLRRAALELLVPVWVEHGRDQDLQRLVEDPALMKQHGQVVKRHWPASVPAAERLARAEYDPDAALSLFNEMHGSGEVERAHEFLRACLRPGRYPSDGLARLASTDKEAFLPVLEEQLEAALASPAPDPDSDLDEFFVSLEDLACAVARLGSRDLSKRAYDRLASLDNSASLMERQRNLELGRPPE